MIPIRDTIRSRTTPVITIALIAVNAFVFFQELKLGPDLDRVVEFFGFIPARFVSWVDLGGSPFDPWRFLPLVTSMFLHGGWAHIAGNMLYLWVFGDNVEDSFGHLRFLVFYLICGVIAALTLTLFSPSSTVPTVGASGAIAGVLGAYFVMFPRSRIVTLVPLFFIPWFVQIPALVYLGFWFLMQLLNGGLELSARAGLAGGVAWWAHAGGFVAGIVLSVPFRNRSSRSRSPAWLA
jgi:membrane associated rhomboid family serine protease